MRPITPRPCLGACGALIKRDRSLPLCKADAKRANAIFDEQVRLSRPANYQRAFNRFFGHRDVVAAALAGNTDVVAAALVGA